MPLTGNFSIRDVSNEFGVNTRPSTLSLRNFYTKIFGSAPAGSRLSDFSGYGQPTISSFTASTGASTGGEVDLQWTLDVGNLDTDIYVEYHKDDGNPAFSGQTLTTSSTLNYTTDGTKTRTITGLDVDDLYWFRLRSHNLFNDDAVADHGTSSEDSANASSAPQFATPSLNGCSNDSFIEVTTNWNYGSDPSTFSAQIRVNGGTWTVATLQSSTNWNTSSNPKSGTWSHDAAFNPGDDVEIRVRADAEGGTLASNYSSPCLSVA